MTSEQTHILNTFVSAHYPGSHGLSILYQQLIKTTRDPSERTGLKFLLERVTGIRDIQPHSESDRFLYRDA